MVCPVVSVLNMKGGVGKTTISAHVFRVFYHRKQKKVLLVDFDPQFNLTQSVVIRSKYDALLDESKSVMSAFEPPPADDFFKVKKSQKPPPDAKDISTTLRTVGHGEKARLDLLVGDFRLVKYSLIDDPKQLKVSLDYFKIFISKARDEYDLIVVDCNPSSSFITKCALECSTHVLSPVRPDRYSVLGVEMVDRLFQHLGLSPEHFILFNGLGRNAPPSNVETELRAHKKFGPKVLSNRVNYSKLLHADQDYTGFATDKKVSWSSTLRIEFGKISDEISARIGV